MGNEVEVSDLNGVRTVRFNRPQKLNGWSEGLRDGLFAALDAAAKDEAVKAVIITGAGSYYSAGVDFAGGIAPMHPRSLFEMVKMQNERLFNAFIEFPKPLFAALNGPSIGAAVTSVLLMDGAIASETMTLLTPFKALGLVPEGCSSYTYPKLFGAKTAQELWDGKKLDAHQACELGFVDEVVAQSQVQAKAQQLAETFVQQGRQRKVLEQGLVEKLKQVNAEESVNLANAILDHPFLDALANFSYEKGKYVPFLIFWTASKTRPLWSKL